MRMRVDGEHATCCTVLTGGSGHWILSGRPTSLTGALIGLTAAARDKVSDSQQLFSDVFLLDIYSYIYIFTSPHHVASCH